MSMFSRYRHGIVVAALLCGVGAVAPATAQPVGLVLADAAAAYANTNYARAIVLYEKALALGHHAGGVYYNLGDAYYRDGRLGKAIAAFLRARRLMPRDGDLLANLEVARQQTRDGVPLSEPPPALRSLLFLYYYVSLDELLWCLAALLAALFIGWSWYAFVPLGWLKTALVAIGLAAAVTLATAGAQVYEERCGGAAVVVADEAPVHAGPEATFAEVFVLHSGTEVRVLEQQRDWAKISVGKKERGWMRADALDCLR